MSERRKILDMLAGGQVSAEEADELLNALESEGTARPRPPARLLRIEINADGDHGDETQVRVNVPLGLAKFASQFIPKDARGQLESQGIDLAALVDSLQDDVPEGRLVDINVTDEHGEEVQIIIEVE